MANKHSDVIDRSILYQDDVKHVEEMLGKPISSFSLDEVWNAYEKKHKLQETVSVGSNLVAAKVVSSVINGARFFGDKWKSIVTIDNLAEEQEKIPVFSEKDFIVWTGPNKDGKQSGGDVAEVAFDVTKENTTKSMSVAFRKRDVERKKFDAVQNAVTKAGAKMSKFVLDEVVKFLVDNAATTEALSSNDRFTAVSNLVAKLEEAGFTADAAAMTPTDFAQVLQTQVGTAGPMPFITNTMLDNNGQSVRGLKAGEDYMLLGHIPGVKAVNSDLAGDLVVHNKESIRVGLFEDIKITDWDDVRFLEKGFNLETTYEIKTHAKIDDGIGKVTGV